MISFPNGFVDQDGNRHVHDVNVANESCGHLFIGGPGEPGDVILEKVTFSSCSVTHGEFGIFSNVRLIDVSMHSMRLARRLRISSAAHFDNVVLSGSWEGAVWIGPSQVLAAKCAERRPAPALQALDLEQLRCEDVTVLGVPLGKITFDPQHFVGLKLHPAAASKEWRSVDSWLEVRINYILQFAQSEGVFSLPTDESSRSLVLAGIRTAQELGMVDVVIPH